MHNLTKIFQAALLVANTGFALNSGLVQCDGLFLLDWKGKKISAKGCYISDSLQTGDWAFGASIGKAYYHLGYHRDSDREKYSWNLKMGETLTTGHVSLSRDFRFVGVDANIDALPAIGVSSRFHLPDSLFYANASIGSGLMELSGIHWESDWKEDYVPIIDGSYRSHFLTRSFSAGSKLQNHLLQGEFYYGETSPAIEDQWGYAFSDSSDFWSTGLRYRYNRGQSKIKLSYTYVYADLRLFGLRRENGEEVDEKRFAYLPIGIDLNLFQSSFKHRLDNGDEWNARAMYGTLEVNFPWEKRRFYEALAPNRAMKSSILKTLSFSVFQRSFRIYGDIDGQIADIGFDYEWNQKFGRWHFTPKTALDVFYASFEAKLNLRKENSGMFYITHETDSWEYEGYISGAIVGIGTQLQSPSRMFFFAAQTGQLVPFSYDTESRKIGEEIPNTEVLPEGGNKKSSSRDRNSISKKVFRNGFFIDLQLGFRI